MENAEGFRRAWFWGVSCLVSTAFGWTLLAQEAWPPAQERAQVTLVEVPVRVFDADGEPVRSLGAEDFEIYDEGYAQVVQGAEEVRLAVASEAEACPSISRRLLLVFDLDGVRPGLVRSAADEARAWVGSGALGRCDLVAVLTFDITRGARLRLNWSRDRSQLLRALDLRPRAKSEAVRRRDDALRFQVGQEDPLMISESPLGARDDFRRQRRRVSEWLAGLEDLTRMVAGSPDPKILVLFSAGFDDDLLVGREASTAGPTLGDSEEGRTRLEAEVGDLRRIDSERVFGSGELRRGIARLADLFQQAEVDLRLVDLRGLETHQATQGLAQLAEATGGELMAPGNRFFDDLEAWLDRTRVHYLLSFQPDALEEDGRYHRLEVRLRQGVANLRVEHRQGYFAPRAFVDLHPLERGLLAAEAVVARPRQEIDYDVLLSLFRGDQHTAYVPVVLEIPGPARSYEIFVYAMGPQGEMLDHLAHQEDRSPSVRGLKFYGDLEIPTGSHTVRVLVREGVRGLTGVRTLPLDIPVFDESTLLVEAFFVEESESWDLARESIEPGAEEVTYPFTVAGRPFVPRALPAFVAEEPRTFHLFLQGSHLVEEPRLSVFGPLEVARPPVVKVLACRPPERWSRKCQARLDPGDLVAGEHALRLEARLGERTASTEFTVRVLDQGAGDFD